MRASSPSVVEREESTRGGARVGLAALSLLWQGMRLPLYALLAIVEPIVRFVLCAVALLGVLTAFVSEFASPAQGFPFWAMMAGSVGCVLMLMLYHGLLRLLSR